MQRPEILLQPPSFGLRSTALQQLENDGASGCDVVIVEQALEARLEGMRTPSGEEADPRAGIDQHEIARARHG